MSWQCSTASLKHSIREMYIVNAANKMCNHLNDNPDNVE